MSPLGDLYLTGVKISQYVEFFLRMLQKKSKMQEGEALTDIWAKMSKKQENSDFSNFSLPNKNLHFSADKVPPPLSGHVRLECKFFWTAPLKKGNNFLDAPSVWYHIGSEVEVWRLFHKQSH